MTDSEKIELLKEYARFERYKKEPIANALISLLVKKTLSHMLKANSFSMNLTGIWILR